MQYLLLIHAVEGDGPQYGTPAFDKLLADYDELTRAMMETGAYMGGNALQPTATTTATSVRVRDGKRETMDGPFAVTKEALGGYYLVECPDLNAALDWASRIPNAQWGTVKVRPMMPVG